MKKQSQNFDVIIIGGGASGMMAAGVAGQNGAKVLLLEKNPKLGEKLKITGGGRCNITNAEFDNRVLLKKYGEGEQFFYSAFDQFGVKDTFEFFESKKLPIIVEASKRAFPASQKALDVFLVLEKVLKDNNVVIKSNSKIISINSDGNKISSVTDSDGTNYVANNYILATGGQSHPETGSTGDGFFWLKKLGHTVVAPTPSIVPLSVKEKWATSLSGNSLEFVRIDFYVNGQKKFKKKGKILFTHFGISGPMILNSAKKVDDLLHEGIVTATIDMYPELDHGALEQKIIKIFDSNKNKMLKNIFSEIVEPGTKDVILSLLPKIDSAKKVHSVTKEERKQIVFLLKNLPLTINGLMGFDRAVVADGGVVLTEIDTKTMRSKLFKNLFITGDLLHVNRMSGGYSLQLCWTTGFVAGKNAVMNSDNSVAGNAS
ncbi:MAG TPA: NAD(P)/FAD-dependent oxidoreductase [Candidatus Paceibacterota bacterium]|mgnify:CR=1 FL=1|nr:NAD(P)/FAD-dependent oxidoreductase [Candidatus Paceibacterota bacterium]